MRCLVSGLMHRYQLCAGIDTILVLVPVQLLEQCWSRVCRAGQTLHVSLKHLFFGAEDTYSSKGDLVDAAIWALSVLHGLYCFKNAAII